MRILGYDITITKAMAPLVPVDRRYGRGGWYPIIIHEPHTGAWQANQQTSTDTVLAHFAVYACITLIANDVSKNPPRLVAEDDDGIWSETENPAFSPVLRKPNGYQNRIQFFQWWVTSLLTHGNMYALKQRDGRGVVTALYILDPLRVTPLVAPDRSVFYELKTDNLTGLTTPGEPIIVPAREIIHDRVCPLFHPLVGLSPLFAAALPALQGLRIENNSSNFFANGSVPSGILTAPLFVPQDIADDMKTRWEAEFGGPENAGKVAVLTNGLTYQPITHTALNSQLIEQLQFTATMVCACFHVPPFMLGLAGLPSVTNPEVVMQLYYAQCLQSYIEGIEVALDEGLELPRPYGTECDLQNLLRMDSATKMQVAANGVNASVFTPNEARRTFDLPPKAGGESPYLQQQYYSLEALNRRDSQSPPPPTPPPAVPEEDEEDEDALTERAIALTRQAWSRVA